MTREEANKKAKAYYNYGIVCDIFSNEALRYAETAVEALEKQIPKQLNYEVDGYTARCPICKHCFEYDIYDWESNYCHVCGQALKWCDNDK